MSVRGRLREHPLGDAQPSLRPVRELSWETGDLALRLTAQGPWDMDDLLAIAASVSRLNDGRKRPKPPNPARSAAHPRIL